MFFRKKNDVNHNSRSIVHLEQMSWYDKLVRVKGQLDLQRDNRLIMKQRNAFMKKQGFSPKDEEAQILDIIMAYEFLKHGQNIDYDHDGIFPAIETGNYPTRPKQGVSSPKVYTNQRRGHHSNESSSLSGSYSAKQARTTVFRMVNLFDNLINRGMQAVDEYTRNRTKKSKQDVNK